MNLKHLTDSELLKDTLRLTKSERELTTKILHHLKEIDRRRLYCSLKCSSLHEYCVKVLGYAEASAHRRIQAARLLNDLPEIENKIEEGFLSLTNIAQAATLFNQQEIKKPEEKREVLLQLENLTRKEGEKKLIEIFGIEKPAREEKRRINNQKSKVVMILMDETLNKLERVRGLIGKKNLSQDDLISRMADISISHFERSKFKILKGRRSPPPAEVTERYVPAALKREVYQRDKVCTNCGGSFNLNYDHRIPVAWGGKSTKENLRLLCFQCNQWARREARL